MTLAISRKDTEKKDITMAQILADLHDLVATDAEFKAHKALAEGVVAHVGYVRLNHLFKALQDAATSQEVIDYFGKLNTSGKEILLDAPGVSPDKADTVDNSADVTKMGRLESFMNGLLN